VHVDDSYGHIHQDPCIVTTSSAWLPLDSAQPIDDLLTRFNGFHDGCLREMALATESYVDERHAMAVPGHLDTAALLYFHGQGKQLSAIEMRCEGISHLKLRPTPEGDDSIIAYGTVQLDGARCRLAVYFMGGPLTGPPNGWLAVKPSPPEDPDLEIIAERMEWRPLPNTFGNTLRYRNEAG